jgi:hypothetical protein
MNNQEKNKPKKITAYVNTIRIHWLVEELYKEGIQEIMVTEYFRPNSQISKFEFFCEENQTEDLRSLIHNIGTCGKPADHLFLVKDVEGKPKSIFPFI